MKQLIVAFGLVIAGEVICYFVLNSFSASVDFRNIILALVLAAFTPIHQTLKEHSRQPRFSTEPSMVVPLTEYGLPWHLFYVYGILIYFATMLIGGALGGILVVISAVVSSLVAINLFGFFLGVIGVFFLGRWIGVRYSASFIGGILIVVAFVATAVTLDKALLFIIMPEDVIDENVGNHPTLQLFWKHVAVLALIYSVIGVLGFCRGRAIRIGSYLHFLLKRLPKDTQSSFIDLVYQEAENQSQQSAPLNSENSELREKEE